MRFRQALKKEPGSVTTESVLHEMSCTSRELIDAKVLPCEIVKEMHVIQLL